MNSTNSSGTPSLRPSVMPSIDAIPGDSSSNFFDTAILTALIVAIVSIFGTCINAYCTKQVNRNIILENRKNKKENIERDEILTKQNNTLVKIEQEEKKRQERAERVRQERAERVAIPYRLNLLYATHDFQKHLRKLYRSKQQKSLVITDELKKITSYLFARFLYWMYIFKYDEKYAESQDGDPFWVHGHLNIIFRVLENENEDLVTDNMRTPCYGISTLDQQAIADTMKIEGTSNGCITFVDFYTRDTGNYKQQYETWISPLYKHLDYLELITNDSGFLFLHDSLLALIDILDPGKLYCITTKIEQCNHKDNEETDSSESSDSSQ